MNDKNNRGTMYDKNNSAPKEKPKLRYFEGKTWLHYIKLHK